MSASTHHIKLILELKAQLFNYQDTMNDILIHSGLRLMEGYTLRFPDSSGTFKNDKGETFLHLHTIHRYLYNCPGLRIFGPNKYWSSGDIYHLVIDDFVQGQRYEQEIVLQEPFNDLIALPFDLSGAWSLTLRLVNFGGNNKKAWQNYLDSDYDSLAINLLNQLPKDFGLPLILRDCEFLQRVVTVYNQNKQQNKKMPLKRIIRSQIPAYRKQLLDHQFKLALLTQQSGNPLIYDFVNFSEFEPVYKLSRLKKLKISLKLWKAFFTI